MIYGSSRYRGVVLLALVAVTTTCGGGEELIGPTSGTLEVTSSTTGTELDVDGYTIQIDGQAGRALGPTATIRFTEITPGSHTVLLAGLTANCTVAGDNPRSVSVTAGQTTEAAFAITCSPTTGRLHITATTTGPSPDPDGYTVTLDGTSRGALATSGEITIEGLTPGPHSMGLSDVSGNCQVEGDNPRTADIPAGGTFSGGAVGDLREVHRERGVGARGACASTRSGQGAYPV